METLQGFTHGHIGIKALIVLVPIVLSILLSPKSRHLAVFMPSCAGFNVNNKK
jgi:hypothetical protein